MEPAVVSVIFDPRRERLAKRNPRRGEMVRMTGRLGLFVVERVDGVRGVADLMPRARPHELETNVPFHMIGKVGRDMSKAIQKFLSS